MGQAAFDETDRVRVDLLRPKSLSEVIRRPFDRADRELIPNNAQREDVILGRLPAGAPLLSLRRKIKAGADHAGE